VKFRDPPAMELVLGTIAAHADAEGWAHVGLRQLADELGMSRAHVDRMLERAEYLGLLVRERPSGYRAVGTRYQILEPEAVG
jgi:DNA-binding MarR family transcriptional regulator